MKNSFLRVLFICFLCGGCSTTNFKIIHHADAFDGYVIDRTEGNYIDATNLSCWISLDVLKTSLKGSQDYNLILEFRAPEWLNIGNGESLVLLVDNERLGFIGEGSIKNRKVITGQFGSWSVEIAKYSITKDELIKIANASEIKMKIKGESNFVERSLNKENINNFKNFVNSIGQK